MKAKIRNISFLKDFSWYFVGSFFPLAIGFIKTPIFTRHFGSADYGYLGIVSVTFSYFGMFLFSWIGSCIWRFYTKYKEDNQLNRLYSNLIFIYLNSLLILAIITMVWFTVTQTMLVKRLLLLSFVQLSLNQLILFYMVIIRMRGEAKLYTFFQSMRAVLGVLIALLLVFVFSMDITGLVFSLVIIDAILVLILAFYNPVKVRFNFRLVTKKDMVVLLRYGSAGLLINVGLLIITSSDRYMIAWLSDINSVGIYDQIYKISQLSIAGIFTIFFNTINPRLLNELEVNFNKSQRLIGKYLHSVLLIVLPLTAFLSIFSKEIANILFGEEFREGYVIIPFILFAAYFQGISNFYELRLKFSNKLKRLSVIILIAAAINILLNYTFISLYNYKWAAVATSITYLWILGAFHYFDRKIVKSLNRSYVNIILTISIQIVVFLFINNTFEPDIINRILIGIVFVFVYIFIFRNQFVKLDIPVDNSS